MQKKLLSAVMATAMCFGSVSPIFASGELPDPGPDSESGAPTDPETGVTPSPEVDVPTGVLTPPSIETGEVQEGENNIPVTMEVMNMNKPAAKFSVTAPTALPIVMDLSGNVIVATNAAIKNNSNKAVKVTDVKLAPAEKWTIADYSSEIGALAVDTKALGMSINSCETSKEGLIFRQEAFPDINMGTEMKLDYAAKIPRQSAAVATDTVANSTFIIGWADGSSGVNRPMAKGTEIDVGLFNDQCSSVLGKVNFSRNIYTGDPSLATDISKAQDESAMLVIVGRNATVYGDGGVKAPANCSSMFANFKAAELDLSGLDTSGVTNMYYMFGNMQTPSVDLSVLDTSKVTNMNYMFSGCKSKTISGMTSFDTSKVTNMSYMFDGAAIENMDMSSFDTSAVTDMSYMFQNFMAPTLDVSHLDTQNVNTMYYMFYNNQATKLTGLVNFNTAHVTTMYGMFYKSKFKELDFSRFNTGRVSDMRYMFAESEVDNLDLSSFNTSWVSYMENMFRESHAKVVDMSSFDMRNVPSYDSMFYNSKANTVYVRDSTAQSRAQSSKGNCSASFTTSRPYSL